MIKEITKKILKIVPDAEDISLDNFENDCGVTFSRVIFKTQRTDKYFGIGIVIFSFKPVNFSFTSSSKDIINNLNNFK